LQNRSTILFGFVILLFSMYGYMWYGLYIYIYIYIYTHFRRDTVLSKNSFLKLELHPNVFTDPVVIDLLFRWVGRRKGEIQRHWRQLGPCVCRLVWHLNTNTHTYTHSDLLLSRHTRFHSILSISIVSVSDPTPATTHYIPFINKTQNETTKYNFNNTVLLTPCPRVKFFDTKLVTFSLF